MMRREVKPPRPSRAARSAAPAAAPPDFPESATPLFEHLRAWRAAMAKEQGVPAYVIFHDATLRAIATLRPATLTQLGTISGIGQSKLTKFGQPVLDAINELAATPAGRAAQAGPPGPPGSRFDPGTATGDAPADLPIPAGSRVAPEPASQGGGSAIGSGSGHPTGSRSGLATDSRGSATTGSQGSATTGSRSGLATGSRSNATTGSRSSATTGSRGGPATGSRGGPATGSRGGARPVIGSRFASDDEGSPVPAQAAAPGDESLWAGGVLEEPPADEPDYYEFGDDVH